MYNRDTEHGTVPNTFTIKYGQVLFDDNDNDIGLEFYTKKKKTWKNNNK